MTDHCPKCGRDLTGFPSCPCEWATCGHDDGWCGGVLGADTCTRDQPPRRDPMGEHHMGEEDLWRMRTGQEGDRRWAS